MQEISDRPSAVRRSLLAGLTTLAALSAMPALAALRPATPRQAAGPFYPVELPLDDDNDLVSVAGQPGLARGEISDLGGRLLDRNGTPLAGVRIEIWQCDANGRYRHPRDPNDAPIDPAFQGFGHTLTDADGRYRFRTIKPVSYPGRTPHIHVAVRPAGETPFVTQLYVAGEPGNAGDFLYQRLAADQRELVTAEFARHGGDGSPLRADWDIVLGVAPA